MTAAPGARPRSDTAATHAAYANTASLPVVWINGQRQASSEGPHVSARDRGLTLADGVFETMRCRSRRLFRGEQHLARLEHGLVLLGFPSIMADVRAWLDAALAAAPAGEVSVRLTVTRGDGTAFAPAAGVAPTVIVTIASMPRFPPATYDAGLTAHVASGRFNSRSMTAGLKTLAYTDAVAALLEALRAGADEALWLNGDDHCCEATASNLFAVIDGTLTTPPLSCGVLPGITRAAVIELARAAGVPVEERTFGLPDLLRSSEAFLTSSLRGLAPLVRVNGEAVGSGAPGQLTRRLAEAYAALVTLETGA